MAKAIKYINNVLTETTDLTKVIALGVNGLEEVDIKPSAAWSPHPDWIDISTVKNNEINLLVSDGGVGIAFAVTVASSGTYTIDWGDTTVETSRASGTTYSHQYTIGSGTSVNNGQYTVFKIRIYGATGNITRFQMKKHPNYSNATYAPVLWAVFGTVAITTYAQLFGTPGQVECRELQACTIPSFASCTSTYQMFYNCSSLSSITLPTSWGSVTDARYMFCGDSSLSSITLPTSWGSITDASFMLANCSGLSSITLPTSWGSITNASYMFAGDYSLSSITLPTSWGSITNASFMFNGDYSLSSLTLPTTWGSITNASYMFNNNYSLRILKNLNFLGHQTTAADFTDILANAQAISGTLTIASQLTKIGIYGASGYSLKCTGIRLTNGASTWTGSSPQINVSYCSLDATALNTLFGDLETITGKTINITGNPGAATCDKTIATNKGWTVIG